MAEAEAVAPRPSGWTVDTLLAYTNARVDGVVKEILAQQVLLDERYATQTKATEAARVTQETAMQTALTAAKVLSDAATTATVAAQAAGATAQQQAIDKAEKANDKRFEALTDKYDSDTVATGERLREMENRLLTQMSQQTGSSDEVVERRLLNAERRGNVMMLAAFCAIAVSILSVFVH